MNDYNNITEILHLLYKCYVLVSQTLLSYGDALVVDGTCTEKTNLGLFSFGFCLCYYFLLWQEIFTPSMLVYFVKTVLLKDYHYNNHELFVDQRRFPLHGSWLNLTVYTNSTSLCDSNFLSISGSE